MIFDEENKSLLKSWLYREFQRLNSDSDVEVLADYVLALLERDMDIEAHKTYVASELETFVDNSKDFAGNLFKALQDKSYKTTVSDIYSPQSRKQDDEDDYDEDDDSWHRNRDKSEANQPSFNNDVNESSDQASAPDRVETSDSLGDRNKNGSDVLSKSLSSRFEPEKRDFNRKRRDDGYRHDNDRQRRRYEDGKHNNFRDFGSHNHPQFGGMLPHPGMLPPPGYNPYIDFHMMPPNPMFFPGPMERGPQGPWMPFPTPLFPPPMFDGPFPHGPPIHHNRRIPEQHLSRNNRSGPPEIHPHQTELSMGYKPTVESHKQNGKESSNQQTEGSLNSLNPLAEEYIPTGSDDPPLESTQKNLYPPRRGGFSSHRGGYNQRHNNNWKGRGWNQFTLNKSDTTNRTSESDQINQPNETEVATSADVQAENKALPNETENTANPVVEIKPKVFEAKITKENVVMQQKYEDLRKLRTQVDDIWKKKETLLQNQVDKIRNMIGDLEKSSKNTELVGNLEGKLINLQSQLQDVREQREKGTLSNQVQQEVAVQLNAGHSTGYQGRGSFHSRGRGRFSGRSSFSARGGRSLRGRFSWRSGHTEGTPKPADMIESGESVNEQSGASIIDEGGNPENMDGHDLPDYEDN